MTKKCELFEICKFINDFEGISKDEKDGWIKDYCENWEKSEMCERKKIKMSTGNPPVLNMTPVGDLIPKNSNDVKPS